MKHLNLYPTDSISTVYSLSILQHLSISHHGAQKGEGRKLKFFKKQQGFFHMYTYEHKTNSTPILGERKSAQFSWQDLCFLWVYFGLLIHYVIKSIKATCQFKVPNETLSLHATLS